MEWRGWIISLDCNDYWAPSLLKTREVDHHHYQQIVKWSCSNCQVGVGGVHIWLSISNIQERESARLSFLPGIPTHPWFIPRAQVVYSLFHPWPPVAVLGWWVLVLMLVIMLMVLVLFLLVVLPGMPRRWLPDHGLGALCGGPWWWRRRRWRRRRRRRRRVAVEEDWREEASSPSVHISFSSPKLDCESRSHNKTCSGAKSFLAPAPGSLFIAGWL